MSALGQKQTLDYRPLMSALAPKADIRRHEYDVRFVPKADIASLFDHLVGREEKKWSRQGSWHSFGRSVTSAILWG
jgi:hypothetical protein